MLRRCWEGGPLTAIEEPQDSDSSRLEARRAGERGTICSLTYILLHMKPGSALAHQASTAHRLG